MSGMFNYWRSSAIERFANREDIGKDELYRRYFMKEGLSKEKVFECLNLIELEYEIPAGLLRPEDRLEKLFGPVETKSPWRWLVYQVREGQSQTEIINELAARQRKHGTYGRWSKIETIEELVRSWCGQKPNQVR